jgi:hypothetical protein
MCYAFKQRSHWYIVWLPFGYLILSFSNYFMCTSFFVDIIYLESYTHERSYISSWYPYSFMSTIPFSFYIFGGSVEVSVVWVRVLPLCILVHSCLVKTIVLVLVLTSLLFPIFIMGCHKLWFLNLHISKLVNPFAWCVCVSCLTSCVWEGHVWHLVSHLLKTMLMLNSHPYISLLKCFDVTHTHRFGCAYY